MAMPQGEERMIPLCGSHVDLKNCEGCIRSLCVLVMVRIGSYRMLNRPRAIGRCSLVLEIHTQTNNNTF